MSDVMLSCWAFIQKALSAVVMVLAVTSVLSLPIVIPIVDDWFNPPPGNDTGGDGP